MTAAASDAPESFYARQISLPEVGLAGQTRLRQARILVVGAGGLGCPLLMNLAGAGIGRLGLIDGDRVSASNLNRQFLYTPADIGQKKAELARQRLAAYHPDLIIEDWPEWLTLDLARALFPHYDLIVAAVDSQAARRLINHVCCELRIPMVDGGVRSFTGYVALIEPGKTPCYDCLFGFADLPLDQSAGSTENPADRLRLSQPAGALGATASVIASLEATLAIGYLLGTGNPLPGELLYYHGLTMDFQRVAIHRINNCQACGPQANRSATEV